MKLLNIRNILLLGFLIALVFTHTKAQTDFDGDIAITDGATDGEIPSSDANYDDHGTSDGAAEVAQEAESNKEEQSLVTDEEKPSADVNPEASQTDSEQGEAEATEGAQNEATEQAQADATEGAQDEATEQAQADATEGAQDEATEQAQADSTEGAHDEATTDEKNAEETATESDSQPNSDKIDATEGEQQNEETESPEAPTEDSATEEGSLPKETEEQATETESPQVDQNDKPTEDDSNKPGEIISGGDNNPQVTEIDEDEQQMTTDDEENSGDSTDSIDLTTPDLTECNPDEFKCDLKCLSNTKRCDSVLDCLDGSDEADCSQTDPLVITTSPPAVETTTPGALSVIMNPDVEELSVQVNGVIEFTCEARGPYEKLLVLVYKDQEPINQSDNGFVSIKIENVKASDAGNYLCYGFPEDRSSFVVRSLNVNVGQGSVETNLPSRPDDAKYKEVPIDSNTDLECDLSNEEGVKWRRVDGTITEYNREYYGKLFLYYLRAEDSGLYECELPDGRSDKIRLAVVDPNEQRPTQPVPEPTREPEPQPQPEPDQGDYKYAIRAYVKEPVLRYNSGDNVEQECDAMTNGDNLEIKWYNQRKQEIVSGSRFTISTTETSQSPLGKLSKLTVRGANPADSGFYECVVSVGSQKETVSFELQTESSENDQKPPIYETPVCDIDQATCRNGQCIPRSGLCDGRTDCSDGSDESFCGATNDGRCEPNEKQCRNQKCIQKIWFCDGENDCGDNSDEDQCPQPKPGEICKTHEFLCRNRQQCVLKGFVCDGEYDCLDQSDEIGCEKPSIVRGPIRNLTVVVGRTFTIQCEATGFPAPYINWRLNWGHVCEEPRCQTTNENGVGTLTINDARLADAGAYSCEALNSKGRVFAIPDAIVYVQISSQTPVTRPQPSTTPEPVQPFTRFCDPNGSFNRNPPCQCRPYISGTFCDQCPERKFHLVIENRNSLCSQCFCNGLQVNCRSSNLLYDKIESSFARDNEDWIINNQDKNLRTDLITRDRSIEYRSFEDNRGQDLYFFASPRYLGNKLGSYGGNLSFNIRFEGPSSAKPRKLDVRLSGNGINLIYRYARIMYPYQDYKVNVLIAEDDFRKAEDNSRIDRETLLTVLADLDKLMIRARFLDTQYAAILNQISFDHAERANSPSNKKALAVETCDCPVGYTGKSCESCAPGYTRTQTDYFLGRCEKVQNILITFENIPPNNVLTLTPGQNHVVYVTVVGSGDYVSWVKEPEGNLPNGVSQQYNNLVIQNARPEISGNYTCLIITPNGEIKKVLVINIPQETVRQPPRIYSSSPRVQSVSLGEPFVLECSAVGDPRPRLRIEAPSSRLFQESRDEESSDARYQVNYFTADNAGTYYCIADNGIQVVEKFQVDLKTGYPPFIQIYPKEIEAYEGSSLTINYTITGTQPVQVRVKLYSATNQEQLGSISVDKDTNTIMIRQITKDMDGQYLIEASNDYGTVQDYFSLRVLETPGPRIMISETVIRAQSGANINIKPQVQFSGRPYFTWTKDGAALPVDVLADRQNLYIPSTSKVHQGTYTLTLIDDYGTAKIQVNLIVEERMPSKLTNPSRIIIKHDTDVELEAGKNANLLCQIHQRNSNNRVISTTSWIRGNKAQRERFPSNIRPNQERLQIIKVKPSDAGQYTCIVSSSDGNTQIAVVNLRVRPNGEQTESVPPSARLSAREKTVNVGESFELTCSVSGYPTPSILWLFNNDKVESLPNVYARDNTLYIRDAQMEFNGYFTCRAVGQDGRYAEESATVRVLQQETEAPRPFSVDVSPRSSNPRAGETVKLECLVFDYDGNTLPSDGLRFTWTKQDGELPSGAYVSGNTLSLYNVQAQDSGSFVCDVEKPTNGLRNSGYSFVNVIQEFAPETEQQPEQQPQQPAEPLKVEVSPKEANFKQGREGELYCTVTGGRNPIIRWKKTGEELDPSRHIVDGNRLRILNASPADRGYFECEAESGDDYSRDYSLVEVEPREMPQIELNPNQEKIELDFGGTLYIQCRVLAGTPTPNLEWRRVDGQPLSSGASVIQDGSLLHISNAGQSEYGTYECIAKNDEGEARGRISILSRGSAPDELRPDPIVKEELPERPESQESAPDVILASKRIEAREGENVNLNCRTSSQYPVRITWYGPDNNYIGGDQEGNVQIENIRKASSGYYTCQIMSSYGDSSDRVFVDVIENEPAQLRVEVRPKSKTASEGGNAEFTCNAKTDNGEAVDDTLIRWSRPGGLPLPDYHSIRGNVLYLYNVKESDGGRYLCTVQATYGRIGFDAAYLQISKRDTTSAFPVYIRVLESPTDTYNPTAAFRYGVRVRAECVAQADDIEEIQWTKSEGVSRATHDRNGNSNTLIIPALVPMDLGTYVCIAIRRNGERAQNSIVFSRIADQGSQFTYEVKGPTEAVEIEPEPEATEQPRPDEQQQVNDRPEEEGAAPRATILGGNELIANVGGSAVIECEVEGADTVELVRHGEELPENHRKEQTGRIHRLSLYNLKETDSGYYLCNVNGPNGSTRDHVFLFVTRSESDGQEPERDQEREEQERLEREREEREREERERLEREREEQEPQQNQQRPLVFIKTLTNGASIRQGEELRLVCLINDPDAQVYFRREDGANADNEQSFVEKLDNSIRHEIIFSPFRGENVGRYDCYAKNRHGESSDKAIIEAEADESFSFRTEKQSLNEKLPGNPHAEIAVRGSIEDGSYVELSCSLEHDNGFPAKSYSWTKYPSLPQSAQRDQNRLSITQFNNELDNGLYTCGVTTDDKEHEKTHLVASNDYLLNNNPFFRFSKSHEEDAVEVRCRPDTASTYKWSSKLEENDSFKIDGDVLVLYRSDATNHFSCDLQVDSEYGPVSLGLEINRDLLDRAFQTVNVNLNASFDENGNVKAECQPGEDC